MVHDNHSGLNRELRNGFTLIELLVVIAIAALVIALTPVAYVKVKESTQYSAALRTVMGDLRLARQTAASQGISTSFFVDLAAGRYGVLGYSAHDLPDSLQIKTTVGNGQLKPGREARISFLPDGGATGGSIEIVRANGEGARLRVDWLTGLVTQERLLP